MSILFIVKMDGRNAKAKKKDQFSMYRGDKKGQSYDPKNPATLSNLENNNFQPKIKRQYNPVNRRTQAQDLVDNDHSGSLWGGQSHDGYLFARDVYKKHGDIIVMKVQGKLKNDITAELKRAFPSPKKKKKAAAKKGAVGPDGKPAKPEEEKVADATPKDEQDVAEDGKVYDQISSIIAEEVNKDYILLRGQKEVIFRSDKHMIEIQALVPRKDLLEDDTVLSSTILESNVTVVR